MGEVQQSTEGLPDRQARRAGLRQALLQEYPTDAELLLVMKACVLSLMDPDTDPDDQETQKQRAAAQRQFAALDARLDKLEQARQSTTGSHETPHAPPRRERKDDKDE